ncbi:MAG: hypothetical protein ABEN55_10525, partial [Bradymonadaceae bacterium]
MSVTQTSCPNCGKPVAVGEPCPHCDSKAPRGEEGVLEIDEAYTFEVEGEEFGLAVETVDVTVRLSDQWADLLSRTVYVAEIVDCVSDEDSLPLDDILFRQLLVEEMKDSFPSGVDQLPPEGAVPLRRPIGDRQIAGARVLMYHNDAGISLAELVLLADGALDARQVTDIFMAVIDGLEAIHDAGLLHLYLNPEAIRIRLRGTEVGVPLSDENEADRSAEGLGDEETKASSANEQTEVDEEREGGGNGFQTSGPQEKTEPMEPLNSRLGELDTEDLPPISGDTSSLGEDTSEVNEAGISSENWIRGLLGIDEATPENGDDNGAATVGQSGSTRVPAERTEVELEALFDATCGLYPH